MPTVFEWKLPLNAINGLAIGFSGESEWETSSLSCFRLFMWEKLTQAFVLFCWLFSARKLAKLIALNGLIYRNTRLLIFPVRMACNLFCCERGKWASMINHRKAFLYLSAFGRDKFSWRCFCFATDWIVFHSEDCFFSQRKSDQESRDKLLTRCLGAECEMFHLSSICFEIFLKITLTFEL